jgi:hypothetical protein
MANKVYDPEADERRAPAPDLGPGHNAPAGKASDPRGENAAAGDASDPRGDLRQAESDGAASSSTGHGGGGATSGTGGEKGLYNSGGDNPSPSQLKDGEESAGDDDDRLGKGFTGNTSSTGGGRRRFKITKKRAVIGFGTSTFIAVVFGALSITQGPLEFIHIAQLLDKFHFSSQQDAQDGRLMKIARYIKDPAKPQNTRLGIVGTAVANKLDTKIKDATGLSSDFDPNSGRFKGYTLDRNHENFKNLNDEELKTKLAETYGIDKSSVTISGGTASFNPDTGGLNSIKSYRTQTRVARGMLRQAGYSKVSSYVHARVLTKRAGWTFHPIKKLDAAIQAKTLEGGKKALDKLKQTFRSDELQSIEGSGAAPADPVGKEKTKSSLKAKLAGGGAAAVAVLCTMKTVDDSIVQERQAKVVLPMMKMAGQVISLGSQAQSGQDISALQLGQYKDLLDKKDDKGNVTSTWNQAQSVQAELGHPNTGTDIPKSGQVFDKGTPFDFLNGPLFAPLGTACGILGSLPAQIISAVLAPAQFLVQSLAGDQVFSALADWLSGSPIDPLSGGADWGNFVNYGARLSASDQFASAGGVPLGKSDQIVLKSSENALDNADFQSHNIAYRVFNPYDSRTLASQIIDNQGATNATQKVAMMAHNFSSIFTNVLKIPASLLAGTVHAAPSTYDYHGMKKVGFTPAELADPKFNNPNENACAVVGGTGCPGNGIFDDPSKASQYTDLASKCFGDTISGDPTTGWNIEFNTTSVNMYDPSYPEGDCKKNDLEWQRVRFWIIDTATIEGYDCYQGDTPTSDKSCTDSGFDNGSTSNSSSSSSSSSSATSSGTLPQGSAKDLAGQLKQYLGKQITCNGGEAHNCPDIGDTADGKSIKHGSCNVDALAPNLVGLMLYLVQQGHTFVFSAICTDHPSHPGSQHHIGEAADFNIIDGVFMGAGEDLQGTVPWTQAKIDAAKKLDQDAAAVLPKSSQFGQKQCGAGTFSFLSGFSLVDDGCHHQHIGVGK